MFILRQLGLVFGLLVGVIASQLPEFAQQYRQRLGGAIDELQRIVADFDKDARTFNMSRSQGLDRLAGDKDPFVGQRGKRMAAVNTRLTRLQQQRAAFANTGAVARLAIMADKFDADIASRAYENFEPAVPVTTEGILVAVTGFLAGLGLWKLLGWPFARLRNRKHQRRNQHRIEPRVNI